MGQRLNIEIVKNKEVIANSYFHWSAYSISAINMVADIISKFNYIKKYKVENVKNKDLLLAVRLLESTGAGIEEKNKKQTIKQIGLIDDNIILQECKGRNEGIIDTTKEGIEENRAWEEYRATIDIDKKTVCFEVFSEIDEDELKYFIDEGYEVKEICINFDEIKFEDIFEIRGFIEKADYEEQYLYKNNYDNKYIDLIF